MIVLSKNCIRLIHFAILGFGLATTAACSKRPAAVDQSSPTNRLNPQLVAQLAAHEAQERLLNETVWAPEILAQQYGQIFEALWDSVNAATNKLAVLADFPAGAITLGEWLPTQTLPHGIQGYRSQHVGRVLSELEWHQWVQGFEAEGWQLGEMELRHNRFKTDPDGNPSESTFYFAAQLNRPASEQRAIIEGDLLVHWGAPDPGTTTAGIREIDASRLTVKTRTGRPPFEELVLDHITPPEHSQSIDPLILYDLDHDGLSEIILAASNVAYHRSSGAGGYQAQSLCRYPADAIRTAVIGDFDGDGTADLLCATLKGLMLFPGTGGITFDQAGRCVFPAPPDWRYPMVLTAGDIDADGDLDLFLGQYQVP